MKYLILMLSCLTLLGCVNDVEVYPLAEQRADLRDFDTDGVINARDACAKTPDGAVITNDGCPNHIQTSQEQDLHVLFANDSYVIAPQYGPELDKMADFLEQNPEVTIEIQGHASQVGPAARNQALSDNRSLAVKNALVFRGIDEDRITIIGFGDRVPEFKDTTEQAHSLNRRAVAHVVGYQGDVEYKWTIFTQRDEKEAKAK